jgi:hypothetical protein
MGKFGIFFLLIVSPALAQTPVAQTADDLREAYAFCTKRYVERDKNRRYDATGKEVAKWQAGFESCDKIVSSWESSQHKWEDTTKHKSMIDAIAGKLQ